MSVHQLSIALDTAPLCATLDELNALLPEFRERSLELFHRLVDVVETGPELFRIEPNKGAAAGAGHLGLVAKPSHGLLLLVAALRAGEFDLGMVEKAIAHISAPSLVRAPMVASPSPGENPGGGECHDVSTVSTSRRSS
jgi:hypothetical protein